MIVSQRDKFFHLLDKFSQLFQVMAIASLLIILIFSLRPLVDMGTIPHTDKAVHLVAYGVLAGLVRLGWPKLWGGTIFIGLALFGIGIEFAQHFMALGRTGSLADMLANMLGAALALIIFHIFWTRHRR